MRSDLTQRAQLFPRTRRVDQARGYLCWREKEKMGWRREGVDRPLMNAAPEKVEVSRRLQKGQISGKFKVRVPCAGQTGPPEPSAPHVTGVLILRTVMRADVGAAIQCTAPSDTEHKAPCTCSPGIFDSLPRGSKLDTYLFGGAVNSQRHTFSILPLQPPGEEATLLGSDIGR